MSETELYRIGTVAKLTGISVECLRAWERRHGLEPAERDGRTRYYSRSQLKRLEKIREIRNDVMHFDPDGLEDEDLNTLREFAQFLKRLRDVGAM